MFAFQRPPRLREGDTVAIVSPSWGGPSVFPHIYEAGLAVLREVLGLRVREMPHARATPAFLARHPEARAEDLCRAFADDGIAAIITSIGGDDSVRVLPHVDFDLAVRAPKILMGFSDATTLLVTLCQRGLVTFHGPSVMAGFAQLRSLPDDFTRHLREMLFDPRPTCVLRPYPRYSDGYPDWADPETTGQVSSPRANAGYSVLQGRGVAEGELFGGCVEVLEFLKGTRWWPEPEFWRRKLLFLETSEEKPAPSAVRRMLRNYGMQGVFERISGLLVGRARDYDDAEKAALDEAIVEVVAGEFGREDLPIVANVDFGHTDPQFVMPLGVRAAIDCEGQTIALIEPAVV